MTVEISSRECTSANMNSCNRSHRGACGFKYFVTFFCLFPLYCSTQGGTSPQRTFSRLLPFYFDIFVQQRFSSPPTFCFMREGVFFVLVLFHTFFFFFNHSTKPVLLTPVTRKLIGLLSEHRFKLLQLIYPW